MITPVFGAKSAVSLTAPLLCSAGFRLSARRPPTRQPFTRTYPVVGWLNPQMQRISVVLPQPFAPTSPYMPPDSNRTVIWRRISFFPYRLDRFSI